MKKLTVEYQDYKLELEITPIKPGNLLIPYIKGTCEDISFIKDGHFKNEDYLPILEEFMKKVDQIIELEEKRQFIYKDYILKLGWIEDSTKQTMRKGGYCKELDYKTYGEDEEANITKFKKYVDWKISEDEFKELKQKGYLMNVNVQEKLKEIDKQINTLLEEHTKLNNQEQKPMNFEYKGYTLEIESKEEDGATRLIGRCTKTSWMLSILGGYDYMIDRYKKDIDSHITATQREKEIDEKKKKEAREIPDLLKNIDEKLDLMRQEFKKSGLASNILGNNQEEKVVKVEDRDVILVDGFLTALDKIQKEMYQINHKYRDMILNVKLRRVFDWYKDKFELKSFDNLKDFYLTTSY